MSGELQIVFIYDTLKCRNEEDNPLDAILYFHPDDIAEDRRLAICGQLMGLTFFLNETFNSSPRILCLQNGKFTFRKFDNQYILALGCSSVTPENLLEKQADILLNLLRFFHRDMANILGNCGSKRRDICERLTEIMDYYIPLSQQNGDLFALTFGILPILTLPKSASNISLQASVLLQNCVLQSKIVLGGIVMYQNKVVGAELFPALAQKIALIQPYQLPPANPVPLSFKLPPGVHLYKIFLSQRDLRVLRRGSKSIVQKNQGQKMNNDNVNDDTVFQPSIRNKKFINFFNSHSAKEMRKGSLVNIDTINECEDDDDDQDQDQDITCGFSSSTSTEYSTTTEVPRLHSLSLQSSLDSSINLNINEPRKRQFDSFIDGKSSQIAGVLLPFCQHVNLNLLNNSGNQEQQNKNKNIQQQNIQCQNTLTLIRECKSEEILSSPQKEKMKLNISNENLNTTSNSTLRHLRRSSLHDPMYPFVSCDGKCISNCIIQKSLNSSPIFEDYLQQLQPLTSNTTTELYSNKDKETTFDINSLSLKPIKSEQKLDKSPTSSSGIGCDLSENSTSSTKGIQRPINLPLSLNFENQKMSTRNRRWTTFDEMLSPIVNMNMNSPSSSFDQMNKRFSIDLNLNNDITNSNPDVKNQPKIPPDSFLKLQKTSMSPTSIRLDSSKNHNSTTTSSSDGESGGEKKGAIRRPQHLKNRKLKPKTKISNNSNNEIFVEEHQKRKNEQESKVTEESALFLYSSAEGMRLILIFDWAERIENEFPQELIENLWEFASTTLPELSSEIASVQDSGFGLGTEGDFGTEAYCYLSYESMWSSLSTGSKNHQMDFDVVQCMHKDFSKYKGITEIIVRGEDHVVYGNECVGSQVFYQQSASVTSGLPLPSDLLGKIPLISKRKLERNHNILIL